MIMCNILCAFLNIQISSNGLVSFTRPYRAWWATPIPFGRYPTPIIAPYWSDIDFRNNLPDSGVYYRIYEVEANDRRTVNVLREFNTRLANYAGINFDAEWLMVVTWKDATPYYGRRNTDEVCYKITCSYSLYKPAELGSIL